MHLDSDIVKLFNETGVEALKEVIEMGKTESFRNYMIQNFRWFMGNFVPHGQRHRCEAAWYRFYIDHGRLIKQIDYNKIINKTLSEEEVIKHLMSVADAYEEQYGLDVLNSKKSKKINKTLLLKGF